PAVSRATASRGGPARGRTPQAPSRRWLSVARSAGRPRPSRPRPLRPRSRDRLEPDRHDDQPRETRREAADDVAQVVVAEIDAAEPDRDGDDERERDRDRPGPLPADGPDDQRGRELED